MIALLFLLLASAPEDSSAYYYMDRFLVFYPDRWEMIYDSSLQGLRTIEGCHDLRTWYINLEVKTEAWLCSWFGVRYRSHLLADYLHQKNYHRFEPRFKIKGNWSLLVVVTPNYLKSDDEFGLGFFKGNNYLNSIEGFLIVQSPTLNFSQKDWQDGREKKVYNTFPFYGALRVERSWERGYFKSCFAKSNTSHLVSRYGPHRGYWFQEKKSFTNLELRFVNTYGRFDFGSILSYDERNRRVVNKDIRPDWFGDTFKGGRIRAEDWI